MDAITGFFREILWGLIYLLLWVTDTLWKVVMKIATLNFFEKGNVAKWYAAIAGLLILFVFFRVVKILIKFFTSEEYRTKLDPIHLMMMIGVASFAIAFTPIAYQYVNQIAVSSVRQMSNFVPSEAGLKTSGGVSSMDAKISDVLIQASAVDLSKNDDAATKEIPDLNNFDINKEDDSGDYMYFPTWTALFFMLGISFLGLRTFLGVALSIGKRSILICVQYLMAPYAIASLVDSEGKEFQTWVQMIGGNFIMNFVQVYGCYFVLYMINGKLLQDALGSGVIGIVTKVIILIAGFMAIENIPSYVGRILGGSSATVGQAMTEATGIGGGGLKAASFGAGTVLGAAGTAMAVAGGAAGAFREADGSNGSRAGAAAGGALGGISSAASAIRSGMKSRNGAASTGASILAGGGRTMMNAAGARKGEGMAANGGARAGYQSARSAFGVSGSTAGGSGSRPATGGMFNQGGSPDPLTEDQRADAGDAGMPVDSMTDEDIRSGGQSYSMPQDQYGLNETPAEEKIHEDVNPVSQPAQAMYQEQARERLEKRKAEPAGRIIDTEERK